MAKNDILLAGFGGQGILFSGKLLAYIGLMGGKEVSWLPSYGPAMRGGTCNCSVVISDEPVGSPLITVPEILFVMNGPSFQKFIPTVAPGGKAFVDSTLIDDTNSRTDIEIFRLPATSLAMEHELKGAANIILLGKLLKETGIADNETIRKAIAKVVPASKAHLIDSNMKAIELGQTA
ncbi:2-oxoglutarate ferredoxin oxidoreductase subunit gamma [Clostridia bacterium]|nr:2-oxoglutarate ferredoxin oxidoreductase subunit gamma [Clostridia bacterium]